MKKDRLSNWLLCFFIVLLSVSIYNINTVINGVSKQYFQGLIVVATVSVVLSIALVFLTGRQRNATK